MKKLLIKKFDQQFTIEFLYSLPVPDPLPYKMVRGIAFAAYFISKNYYPVYSRKDLLINLLGQKIIFSKLSSRLSYNNDYTDISMVGKVKEYVFYFDVVKEKEYTNQIKVSLPKTNTHLFIYLHEAEQHKDF